MTKAKQRKLAKFKRQPYAQTFNSGKFLKPTPNEIREVRVFFGLTQVDVAKVLGATWDLRRGSSTIGKWESKVGTAEHRSIPYSAWRLLLIHVGIVESEGEES